MAIDLVLRADPERGGWLVGPVDGSEESAWFRLKADAEDHGRRSLGSSSGGVLAIYGQNGKLQREVRVAGSASWALPTSFSRASGLAKQVKQEGERVDEGLGWAVDVFALLGFAGIAGVSAELMDDVSNGWIAVTAATFTWTVGIAIIAFLFFSQVVVGAPLYGLAPAIFFVTWQISGLLGTGQLPIMRDGVISVGGVAENAIAAYGPVGALLGVGLGTWLGHRAAGHLSLPRSAQ